MNSRQAHKPKKLSGNKQGGAGQETTSPASSPRRIPGTRARSTEAKQAVRQALIDAGRRAFAADDYAKVSLRAIAAEAGYTPAAIYRHFADRQALFRAVRETDLAVAVDLLGAAMNSSPDPATRLRRLLVAMVKHWRIHFDQYEILFSGAHARQAGRRGDEPPFGQSEVATRAYDLYQTAVREFFDTLPRHPMPLKLATDSLVVAIHGAVAVPMHLDTLRWSAGEKLASAVADTFIKAWVATANES